jgi:uncharacterized lipoprotein YmbA
MKLMVFRLSVVCVCVLNLSGCANTQPSQFYLLQALSSPPALSETKPFSQALGLGPITFPQYLNRPQIVTKASAHEVELAEFHKWAEPLQENVANVLEENLSVLLSTDQIVKHPWKRASLLDYQLSLDVIQFDGTKNREAVLKVRWTLVGEDGGTLLVKKTSHFIEPVGSLDYEDFVQAMSRTLDSLSKEIADAIKGLPSVSS